MWNFSEIPQIPTLISTFPKSGHPPESKKSWDGGSSKLTRMVTSIPSGSCLFFELSVHFHVFTETLQKLSIPMVRPTMNSNMNGPTSTPGFFEFKLCWRI